MQRMLLLALLSTPLAAAEETTADETTLREVGLATDGPGLLRYFRERTLDARGRSRLAELVRQLGDRSFAVREKASAALLAAGDSARPLLKAALKDPDIEVVRRAEMVLATLDRVSTMAVRSAAVRLLAVRRPDGAAEALLAYTPWADPEVFDTVLEALAGLAVRGEGPKREPAALVVDALKDPEPARRAAAAHVLGRCPGRRADLAKMLDDADGRVRYRAARSLILLRDPAGVGGLVRLLDDGPIELGWNAEEVLAHLAADKAPPASLPPTDDRAARKKAAAGWQAWWKENGGKLDLGKIDLDDLSAGRTLVCEVAAFNVGGLPGWVLDLDRGGNPARKVDKIQGPMGAQPLPGGRVLVAERGANRVAERDAAGKVLWEHKTNNEPFACQRLPGGNTFIVTLSEMLEVTPAGRVVFRRGNDKGAMFYYGQKLRDGTILSISSHGLVQEWTPNADRELHSFTPAGHSGHLDWSAVEPLPGGRYLVCLQSGSGRVLETDRTGKVLWEHKIASSSRATRLRNGNTLICNVYGKAVVEVDRNGKEVWKKETQGNPVYARRY